MSSQRPAAAHPWIWQFAIALALAFAAMRVVGVLGPSHLRWLLPLGFFAIVAHACFNLVMNLTIFGFLWV